MDYDETKVLGIKTGLTLNHLLPLDSLLPRLLLVLSRLLPLTSSSSERLRRRVRAVSTRFLGGERSVFRGGDAPLLREREREREEDRERLFESDDLERDRESLEPDDGDFELELEELELADPELELDDTDVERFLLF